MDYADTEPKGEMRDRLPGTTTLESCGWCKYAHGSHRHNYCISGSCDLQKSYAEDVTWDMTCVFKETSKADVDAMIRNHQWSLAGAKNSIERYKKNIKTLKTIRKRCPDRPCMPEDRKCDHFNLEDSIRLVYEGKWIPGVVKNGYRHHDGCVSYRLEGIGPQGGEGSFWGIGMAVPTIMLLKEFLYFRDNPEEFKSWSKRVCAKSYNGKTIDLLPIEPRRI